LSTIDLLTTALSDRAGTAALTWLDGAVSRAARGELEALFAAYTNAPRHTGRELMRLSVSERAALASAVPGSFFDRWTADDTGRAVLLLTLAERAGADQFMTTAIGCYERGDSREQQSWLKALPLLPGPERFLSVAIDACRTNIIPQFESIACENPYPERYFPDLNFNQLVLKAMFNSISLARIVGLTARLNSELSRMALDYAAERRAAGRSVPLDLSLALTKDARTEEQLR
jgi:hypothetical protein